MKSPSDNSTRTPVLGCIADDVTGATDLATNLVQGGMGVVQYFEVPSAEELSHVDSDAIVVALKTRSIPKGNAVAQSLDALKALSNAGVIRFFFKYCSTFDSTEHGNIGPVAEALMDELQVDQTIFCPAFPRNGRTVYQGHLFANGRLLNESGMENHPLNPMTDANLVRYLGKQAKRKVGLLSFDDINQEADLSARLRMLRDAEIQLVITDSCDDGQLKKLADAVANERLVTGGSGIARYLPESYRKVGLLDSSPYEPRLPHIAGRSLILAGSCSEATNRQVAYMSQKCPSQKIDIDAVIDDSDRTKSTICHWAEQSAEREPLLIYSSSTPAAVAKLQEKYGVARVARSIEEFFASIAKTFVADMGFRRLVLAGGETSGAIVHALGVRSLRIGPEICAGVPWTESTGQRPLALALKSGNFGDAQFFATALEMLP